MDNLFSALLASGIAGGGGGGGSYTAGDGLSINDNEISVIPATTEALGGVIIGDGLEVDEEGVLSALDGVEYKAGAGISITDGGPISADYYFDTQVSCHLSGNRLTQTYTKYNTEPAFGAIVSVYTNESFTGPMFVGRTPDSVKYTSNTGNPQGTVVYRDETWYYSTFNGWVDGERVDTLNNMQKIEGLFNIPAQTEDIVFAILDAAYGSPTVAEKEINVIPATTETIGGVIIGDGLEIDESGALSVVGGSGTEYVAGQGIAFGPAGFNPDPAYYFTSKVECDINGRTFTKYNEEPAVAFVITNSSGYTGPIYLGHTEDSVKFTQDYNYTVSDPDGSFEYQGYTWYYSHLGFFMPGSYTDSLGNLKKFTAYQPSEAQMLDMYKAMIDLARAVPSDDKAISAKLGEGLSFDDNDAIKVEGLSELQAKTVGMSAGGSNYITVGGIRVYVSSTAPTGNIPDGSVGVGW